MASSIGQGLQNWLEPCFPMPTLAGMTHKSCDTNSGPEAMKNTLHVHGKTDQLGSHDDKAQEHNYGGKEGWSFIQALSNTVQNNSKKNGDENEIVYVHPLAKRSSSALGTKSLEMCTESLGSETGSDEMPLLSSENHPKERSKFQMAKSCNRDSCFPPALKTVGSSRGVQVKSHREGGRLILEATPSISCFHAERSEGRLRLWFIDDCCLDSIDKGKQVQDAEAEAEEEGEFDHEDIEFEDEFDAENGDYNNSVVNFDKEIEGTSEIADDETAMGKFPRPSRCRCKEGGQGNKGLQNWEPVWVAT